MQIKRHTHLKRTQGEIYQMARPSSTSSEGEPPHSTKAAEAPADTPPTWEGRRAGRQYTIGEEIANSISHGIGAGLSIAALVLLIVFACTHGGGLKLVSAIFFGVSLLLEYLFSTLYHAIQPARAKRVLRVFDHCAI